MAAMVYQIEEANKDAQRSASNGHQSSQSLLPAKEETKDALFDQLDDMFNRVAFENAAIQTDFKH
jgi:hypothetical protein